MLCDRSYSPSPSFDCSRILVWRYLSLKAAATSSHATVKLCLLEPYMFLSCPVALTSCVTPLSFGHYRALATGSRSTVVYSLPLVQPRASFRQMKTRKVPLATACGGAGASACGSSQFEGDLCVRSILESIVCATAQTCLCCPAGSSRRGFERHRRPA